MTDWIDEIAQRRRQSEIRRSTISTGAYQLYEALWKEIDHLVAEAASKGIPVSVDAHEERFDREVKLELSKKSMATLHVKLSKEEADPVIEVTGVQVGPFEFALIGADIVLKGTDIPNAARAILEPFLLSD